MDLGVSADSMTCCQECVFFIILFYFLFNGSFETRFLRLMGLKADVDQAIEYYPLFARTKTQDLVGNLSKIIYKTTFQAYRSIRFHCTRDLATGMNSIIILIIITVFFRVCNGIGNPPKILTKSTLLSSSSSSYPGCVKMQNAAMSNGETGTMTQSSLQIGGYKKAAD